MDFLTLWQRKLYQKIIGSGKYRLIYLKIYGKINILIIGYFGKKIKIKIMRSK